MKIGFFHTGESAVHRRMAALLIGSARRVMPGVEVVQLTDASTTPMQDVDAVQIYPPAPLALAVLEAYARCDGDWLLVDTDVVIQKDVRHVFEEPFAVAVADREGTLKAKEVGTKFMTSMPYNKGAVYSRSTTFWKAAADQLRLWPTKQQEWMGDQKAMCAIIRTGRFAVRVLPNTYNYAPLRRDEDVSDKAIVHYKGERKSWLLEAGS